MNADVPWPWWIGLLIVCAVLLAMAFASGRGRPR